MVALTYVPVQPPINNKSGGEQYEASYDSSKDKKEDADNHSANTDGRGRYTLRQRHPESYNYISQPYTFKSVDGPTLSVALKPSDRYQWMCGIEE